MTADLDLDPARAAAVALLYGYGPGNSGDDITRDCGACAAKPGQPCDGSLIPVFEGSHFARREQP